MEFECIDFDRKFIEYKTLSEKQTPMQISFSDSALVPFFFFLLLPGYSIIYCACQVLIRMLPSYYQHVSQYKNSMVTKFLGVHCVKPVGGLKV